MSFISYSFLLLLLVTFLARLLIGQGRDKTAYLALLLVASLFFYASFVPEYLLLLLFTTLVDYYAGNRIAASPDRSVKRFFLVLSMTANLGLLGYFKYANFFMDHAKKACVLLGLNDSWTGHVEWVLPIGISFFTFESMSYTIDIYWGRLKPTSSYWRFLLFVSFFTHLVAGPIVRAKELLYQFDRKRRFRWGIWLQGFYLMILGFFLKMIVADNIAATVDRYWAMGARPHAGAIVPIALAFLFMCQVLADFCGYTSIAIGGAYWLGFKLPNNFNNPYLAATFREFWSRWHITLSRWIRDYLYFPLGGNQGSKIRSFSTVMVTFLLAGFWHGANLTFVAWGALHGLALTLERLLGFHNREDTRPYFVKVLWYLLVQTTILISSIFFRADNLKQAFAFLGNIVNGGFSLGSITELFPVMIFTVPILLMHMRGFWVDRGWVAPPDVKEKGILCGVMLYFIITFYGNNNAFVYFQF